MTRSSLPLLLLLATILSLSSAAPTFEGDSGVLKQDSGLGQPILESLRTPKDIVPMVMLEGPLEGLTDQPIPALKEPNTIMESSMGLALPQATNTDSSVPDSPSETRTTPSDPPSPLTAPLELTETTMPLNAPLPEQSTGPEDPLSPLESSPAPTISNEQSPVQHSGATGEMEANSPKPFYHSILQSGKDAGQYLEREKANLAGKAVQGAVIGTGAVLLPGALPALAATGAVGLLGGLAGSEVTRGIRRVEQGESIVQIPRNLTEAGDDVTRRAQEDVWPSVRNIASFKTPW